MEIERKFKVKALPEELERYPKKRIRQGYLSTRPVVRARQEGEAYYLTYKGEGMLSREEYNLPLTEESCSHLLEKADGLVIVKDRYFIPFQEWTIELDLFQPPLAPLVVAEVEFSTEAEALAFQPPAWFGEDVTYDPAYKNSALSQKGLP